MTHNISTQDITGLVLAGGRGSRMGGVDKGLQNFQGLPLALHTLMRLSPQVGETMVMPTATWPLTKPLVHRCGPTP